MHKTIKKPDKYLSAQALEPLTINAPSQIPGWETDWRFDARNQQIITPEGKTLHCSDLENYALAQQILPHYESLTDLLKKHMKEIKEHLKLPCELRLYAND